MLLQFQHLILSWHSRLIHPIQVQQCTFGRWKRYIINHTCAATAQCYFHVFCINAGQHANASHDALTEPSAGASDPFGVHRLLTSWCWREQLSPTFSASPPSLAPAELHQELLLGFDTCEGFDHSVLSMVVKKKREQQGQESSWFADLHVIFRFCSCSSSYNIYLLDNR